MLKITINGNSDFEVSNKDNVMNGKQCSADVSSISPGVFHIIRDFKSYTAEVLEADYNEKKFVLRLNGNRYEAHVHDRFDELIKKLGMENKGAKAMNDVKAPMPGMVVDIGVKETQTVSKGDSLIVLEAMKMENILRSSGTGKIKKILVKKGDKVEKNQILIEIEG